MVFGQSHDCGIRSICWFLELTQLDSFIASSYGSQQKVASQVEQLLGQFGHEEDRRLGQQMPQKEITLCEDETFHPQICLVAIEPVSNFLILEAYAEKRDAATWNNAIDTALQPFSVDVIQCVSDEATALLSHAQSHLGADIFQRSSSCVEGRNGQLSLRHHGLRELTPRKLQALRTIHNYVIHRSDHTTSAERFFEIKPRDVIGWLLGKLPMPARPRPNRK